MKTIPEKIIQMLKIEKKHLLLMNKLFSDESDALITFDLKTMKIINEKKLRIMNRSKIIRDLKENLLLEISEQILGKRELIKIEFALGLIKNYETRKEILDLIGEIDELINNLRKTGEKNQKLANHALATIDGTVKSITGSFKKNKNYNEFGKESQGVVTGTILAGRI